jgi:hypothetical protein
MNTTEEQKSNDGLDGKTNTHYRGDSEAELPEFGRLYFDLLVGEYDSIRERPGSDPSKRYLVAFIVFRA